MCSSGEREVCSDCGRKLAAAFELTGCVRLQVHVDSCRSTRRSFFIHVQRVMLAEAVSASAPADWAYTAEGGANVVLSYAGPPSFLTGSAIRLRKCKHSHAPHSAAPDEIDVRFGHEVVAPLLGAAQVVRMELVPVERAFLLGLRDCLKQRNSRPAKRTAEDDVDLEARCVVLTDDLVHGKDVLAVEIKVR